MTATWARAAALAARAAPGRLVEVADRVYGYVQPDGGWCVNNAGAVADDDGVVVVDTAATAARATRLRDAVEGLRAGPRRTLVNTHFHGDHVFGNSLFSDRATIIAHELARTEMAEAGLAMTGLFPGVDWGDIELVLPTVTLADRLTLHYGRDRVAQLIHVGPAHTSNDVVVWLPAERVLFAGDVVMSNCTPFNLMGSIGGALTALQRLRELRPATIVAGHGPIAGPELLAANEAYLRWLQQLAADGHASGLSSLELARNTDLGAFASLLDPERIVGNLHRAYAEIDGRPVNVVHAFGEMLEYAGGTPPSCYA